MFLIPDQLRYALSDSDQRSEFYKFILSMVLSIALLTTGGVFLYQKSNEAPPVESASFSASSHSGQASAR